ncbi:hypothetical protein P879_05526 [Paragonimus westermani]|uniref:Ig-like domain-containing protein n=1 Tax=Paragonimus westermani TaxID=34504 RepID=A0A8T0DSM9_9TREM|nr:hypothetical protein P879_05526 [Paragonimus westermani]
MLVWYISFACCVLPIASGSSNAELLFESSDGQSWTAKGSRAIALNTPFRIRCIAKKYENDSNTEISIILSTHSGTNIILGSGTSSAIIWETQRAQFNHSATYKCILGAFSEVLSIHIYELVELKNSTVPTQIHLDKIGNIKLIRRSVIQDAFSDASNDKSWLSCRCVLSSSSLLELVTLHWEGGLFDIVNNLTELNSLYTQQTERSYSSHQLLMKMRINRFVVDSRAYGEYRCVFSFHKSENVNSIGETAVWWPGPLEKSHTTYWASIWWPVLGVALELVSLGLVFGFFRYCSSKRQLHAYVTSPEDDGTSFGLSRLMDSQSSVGRNQLDAAEVKPSIPLCTMQPVPYTRLLHTSGSSFSSAERLSTANHNRPTSPQVCHGYSNPVMEEQTEHHLTSKTFVPDVREDKEGDEYFWDSENEPTNDDGAQNK